jgi:hypothetical protein
MAEKKAARGEGKSRRGDNESRREKGVAELRSSVIRINSKNASPAENRKEEVEKENVRRWIGGGEQGTI